MRTLRHYLRVAAIATQVCLSIGVIAQVAGDSLPATIPVEVLPVDPALATGSVWVRGPKWAEPRIAMQPAQVARAVVVETGKDAKIYALTLLGEIERRPDGTPQLEVASERHAWCELEFGRPFVQCLQDTDGDRAFDVARPGVLGSVEPLSLNRVGEAQAIDPTSFRAALPEELPKFQVGYESCRSQVGDAVSANSDLRYSTLVRRTDQRQPAMGTAAGTPPGCDGVGELLETRDDGDSVVQFGRFRVLLHPEGDEIATALLEGIRPGTYLGNVRNDRPLIDATAVAASSAAEAPQKPFLYFVTRPTLESTEARAGEPIVVGEVAHGLTGRLAIEIKAAGWGKPIVFPAGTPLFGAAMSNTLAPGSYDPTIVWCAPALGEDGWDSQCFVGRSLVPNFDAFVVLRLSVGSGSRGVPAPIVERGPVDFGVPLTLALRFDGVDRRNVLLGWSVAPAEMPTWGLLRLRRNDQGRGLMAVGGALIEVTPAQDGTSATIRRLGEFDETVDAMPLDAGGLIR